MSEQVILKVSHLTKTFAIRTGVFAHTPLRAVDDVSFEVLRGETLGLVGESGSGNTTVRMCLLRLEEPDSGQILFENTDLLRVEGQQLRRARRHLQMVFQDPLDSLNPRMTAGDIAAEPLLLQGLAPSKAAARSQVIDLFGIVGLAPEHVDRYPHQLSGGQRQRVGIARALATRPQLIVLDEPTSALDVSVQATLLNLLTELQQRFGLSYVFISHDLAVISQQASRVAVMYLGQIVESGPTEAIFATPRHPYTMALLSSIPGERLLEDHQRIVLEGEIPSPLDPPSGCRFHTRCPFAVEACRHNTQALHELAPGHTVACERAMAGEIPTFWLKQERASHVLQRIGDAEAFLAERRAQVAGARSETVESAPAD
jgi:oligopeptide/dipeptide ABC transporter ATP-binding protein